MIASLITSDFSSIAVTDLVTSNGITCDKVAPNASELSFAQIMTRLEITASPILAQIAVPAPTQRLSSATEDGTSYEVTASDEDSAERFVAIAASIPSAVTHNTAQSTNMSAQSKAKETAAGDMWGFDLPITKLINTAGLADFQELSGNVRDVSEIKHDRIIPVDLAILDENELGLQAFAAIGQIETLKKLKLESGGISSGPVALASGPAQDHVKFDANNPDLSRLSEAVSLTPLSELPPLDDSITGPIIEMTGAYTSESVEILPHDGLQTTKAEVNVQASYPADGIDIGRRVEPLPFPRVSFETVTRNLRQWSFEGPRSVATQDLGFSVLEFQPTASSVAAAPTASFRVFAALETATAVTLTDKLTIGTQFSAQGQAITPSVKAVGSLRTGGSQLLALENPSQIAPHKPLADMLHLVPQTDTSPAKAEMTPDGASLQQPGLRILATGSSDRGKGVFGTDRGGSAAVPAKAGAISEMVSRGQVAGVDYSHAVQKITAPIKQYAAAISSDQLLSAMTTTESATGEAGPSPRGGSGQNGTVLASQGSASLQNMMEAALDVRQQGWTKALVHRAISTAQAGGALTIKILPAHLGHITLTLSEGKRGTDLRIIADVPATAFMLRDVQYQISSAFENAGLTLGEYSASTGKGRDQDGGTKSEGNADLVNSADTVIEAEQIPQDKSHAESLSRLNILL